jgi:hypothetical protein
MQSYFTLQLKVNAALAMRLSPTLLSAVFLGVPVSRSRPSRRGACASYAVAPRPSTADRSQGFGTYQDGGGEAGQARRAASWITIRPCPLDGTDVKLISY